MQSTGSLITSTILTAVASNLILCDQYMAIVMTAAFLLFLMPSGGLGSPRILTWEITRDEYVVLLPKTEKSGPDPITWSELSTYSFILLNYAECTMAVREHWARWQQPLQVAYNVKEDSTIVSMVAQGLGAAMLPRLAAMPIPETVESRSLPVPLERVIGVAILANVPPSPAVTRFLDVLKE